MTYKIYGSFPSTILVKFQLTRNTNRYIGIIITGHKTNFRYHIETRHEVNIPEKESESRINTGIRRPWIRLLTATQVGR